MPNEPKRPNASAPPPPSPADLQRYRANRQTEIDSATLYDALAEAERTPALAEVYRRLAATERTHAGFWEARLRAAGAPVPSPIPSRRARTRKLARRRSRRPWCHCGATNNEGRPGWERPSEYSLVLSPLT